MSNSGLEKYYGIWDSAFSLSFLMLLG